MSVGRNAFHTSHSPTPRPRTLQRWLGGCNCVDKPGWSTERGLLPERRLHSAAATLMMMRSRTSAAATETPITSVSLTPPGGAVLLLLMVNVIVVSPTSPVASLTSVIVTFNSYIHPSIHPFIHISSLVYGLENPGYCYYCQARLNGISLCSTVCCQGCRHGMDRGRRDHTTFSDTVLRLVQIRSFPGKLCVRREMRFLRPNSEYCSE